MRQFLAPHARAPLVRHQYHRTEIRASTKLQGQGYYHCLDCNKWIAWLSKPASEQARKIGLLK
jgi:hypothetical protein